MSQRLFHQVRNCVDKTLKIWLHNRASEQLEPLKKEFFDNVLAHDLAEAAAFHFHSVSLFDVYYCIVVRMRFTYCAGRSALHSIPEVRQPRGPRRQESHTMRSSHRRLVDVESHSRGLLGSSSVKARRVSDLHGTC